MGNWKLPVFATLAFALAGSGWILAGHFLSDALYAGGSASYFELVKGLVFVCITASVLFVALTYLDRRNADNLTAGDLGVESDRSLDRGDFVVRWLPRLVVVVYRMTFNCPSNGHRTNSGQRLAFYLK